MANKQSHLNKARLDKFILAFNLPPILKEARASSPVPSNDLDFEEAIQYSVWGVVIPSINVDKVDVPFGGQVSKASAFTRPSYEDVSVNFNVDNRFKNYSTIWNWLNILNDEKTGNYDESDLISGRVPITERGINAQQIPYKNEYSTDMSLYGIDEYNKKVVKFTFKEAFPINLGNIEFDYKNNGEIVGSFTFTFTQLHFMTMAVN